MTEKTKKFWKGVRIAGEALGGTLLVTAIIKYDKLVDDYNKLLEADKKLMNYVETHEAYYPKNPKVRPVDESPNPHWKDYHPSASMVHRAATDVETEMSEATTKQGFTEKVDKLSGFRIISVNKEPEEEAKVCEGN